MNHLLITRHGDYLAQSLPSLGLSLGRALGGMADTGGPYWEDGLIWGSYLFSTGLTFSTDSTLR